MEYSQFVSMMLGTHWDAADHRIRLNYVHANKILPNLENSIRDYFHGFYARFYKLEGVLSKMSIIESTLANLDVEPVQTEPNFLDYAFLELVMARISGKTAKQICFYNFLIKILTQRSFQNVIFSLLFDAKSTELAVASSNTTHCQSVYTASVQTNSSVGVSTPTIGHIESSSFQNNITGKSSTTHNHH